MLNNIFLITKNNEGQRLDNFCIKILKNFSKSLIYKFIRLSYIKVNDKKNVFFYRLKLNDIVKINNFYISSNNIINKYDIKLMMYLKQCVIYEDDFILIINKPSGISVHGGTKIYFNIINTLKILSKNNFLELTHRLDKETSGILLFSKDRQILLNLNNQFKERLIKKSYLVLVHGIFILEKKDEIFCYKDIKEKKIKIGDQGKNIINEFKVIKQFLKYTLIEVITYTGRTHQIRVHLAYLGFPVVNDKKYGNLIKDKFNNLKRLFLHAYKINFYHIFKKKNINIKCDLDNDLSIFLNNLK